MVTNQKQSRTAVISAAVTKEERKRFREVAMAEGTDVSNLLRRLVRGRIAEHEAVHPKAA